MLKSMTGFGRSKGQQNGYNVAVEIKSLNSKFLDAQVKLPKNFLDKELEVRSYLTKEMVRGKVSLSIELVSEEGNQEGHKINKPLFQSYFDEFERMADSVGADKAELFRLALHSPDVLVPSISDESVLAEQWKFVHQHLVAAVKAIGEFRAQEGNSLQKELVGYIQNIKNFLAEIEKLDPERSEVIKARIQRHQEDIVGSDEFDKNRFEQEMIYYIEKLDISEEIVRLSNHLSYFIEVMDGTESQGKKLGFISQEIGREINTIGSKASHAPVQKLVVGMKDELEKIKEQLLNII